jgi:hypothetical protein
MQSLLRGLHTAAGEQGGASKGPVFRAAAAPQPGASGGDSFSWGESDNGLTDGPLT